LHHLSIGHAFGIGFLFDGSHLGGGDKFHGIWRVVVLVDSEWKVILLYLRGWSEWSDWSFGLIGLNGREVESGESRKFAG
jgi:hypothetical protein